MTNTLHIIAAGAMGSAIAQRMAENGARVLTSLKERKRCGNRQPEHRRLLLEFSTERAIVPSSASSRGPVPLFKGTPTMRYPSFSRIVRVFSGDRGKGNVARP
jgi:hypothetical protein